MNILILTYQGNVAGSTQSIRFLCEGLANRGHNVFCGCRKGTLLFDWLKDSPVMVIPMRFSSKLDRKTMRDIRDLVRQHDIQIINAQSSKDRYLCIFAKWLYSLKVKIIHTRRQLPKSHGGYLQRSFYLRGTDAIVAVSEGVKTALVDWGMPENHVHVIRNGTPSSKYDAYNINLTNELRDRYNLDPTEIIIGCVARRKEQQEILSAAAMINRPLTILFVGINSDPKLEEIEKTLPSNIRVIYTGEVSPNESLHFYPLFNLKVLPSLIEGLSQSLLEAMALSVPVIATDAGGNRELIRHEQNGFLYAAGDIKSLSTHIVTILDNQDLREQFVRNGKHTALVDFNIEKVIDNYENFFQSQIDDVN